MGSRDDKERIEKNKKGVGRKGRAQYFSTEEKALSYESGGPVPTCYVNLGKLPSLQAPVSSSVKWKEIEFHGLRFSDSMNSMKEGGEMGEVMGKDRSTG